MADDNSSNKKSLFRKIVDGTARIPRVFTASYKPPIEQQVKQEARGEAWFRSWQWQDVTTRYLPGLGLGFSVAGERYTVVRINGEIQLRTFEDLFETYKKKYGSFTDSGYEIVNIENDVVESLSYYDGKPIWDIVKRIFRHKFEGNLLTMRQGVGETKVTPNHAVYNTEGKVVLSQTNPSLLALREIPSRNVIQFPYNIGVPMLSPYTEHPYKMPKGGIRQRTYHLTYQMKRVYNEKDIEYLARFIGAFLSEGCVVTRKKGNSTISTIEISNTDRTWLEEIKTIIPNLFEGYHSPAVRINQRKKSNYFTLTLISNDMAYVLKTLCGINNSTTSKHKRIPNFIFNSPTPIIEAFLKEYCYGDGDKKLLEKGRYSGHTISSALASGISVLFAILGKQFSFKHYHIEISGEIEYNIYETASLVQYYPNGDKHTQQAHYHRVRSYRRGQQRILIEVAFNGFVYDLETTLSHNFVDACGLIVLHNTTYPYIAVWERIWGAVPTDDLIKYAELLAKEPFVRATMDMHTMITVSAGFDLDYPVDIVIEDFKDFFSKHGFNNLLKLLIREMLVFGNSYAEVVRTWVCPRVGHDLVALKPSQEVPSTETTQGYWWADRVDVVAKHNELYPDHVLDNPYGEITRIKPLNPIYMRVRRDAFGSHPPDEKLIFFNDGKLVLESLEEYVKKKATKDNSFYILNDTRLIRHPFILPTMENDKVVLGTSPYLIEHYYSGDMYTIYTMYGATVKATGNHSVFTWKPKYKGHVFPGELELKETREIHTGDYVLISRKLPVFKETPLEVCVSKIFMENMTIEELHDFGIQSNSLKIEEYENKLLKYLKEKVTTFPRQEYNHYRKRHILPLDFIRANNIPVPDDAVIISWKARAKMKDKLEPNGLLYLLGLILSDGCLATDKKRTGIISFTGDSVQNNTFLEAWLKENNINYSKKWGKTKIIWKEQKKPVSIPMLVIYNRPLYSLCKFLLPKKHELSPWLYTLPLSQLKYFVKGLWDGDGWHKDTKVCFKYFTRDKKLAEDIVLLLKRFEIVASLNTRHSKSGIDYTIQAFVEPLDILRWDEGVKQNTRASIYGDYIIAKVKKVESTFYAGTVYDFEVPGSQSYLSSSGILVHNTVLGYMQYIMMPLVTFLADEVLHLKYFPSSETYASAYGQSMLRPILFHQELLKNYEEIVNQIMNVYLKPMLHVKAGIQPGQEITDEQYQELMRILQRRQPGTDLVTRVPFVEITPIQPPIQSLQTTAFWLEWLHNMRSYALVAPKFMTDPQGLTKATANVTQESYFVFIRSLRETVATQLEQELFPKIMYSLYGEVADILIQEFGVPKILWKPIKEESLSDKAPLIIDLYSSGLLSKNEARKELGFKPLEDEETLQAPEPFGPPQPSLPSKSPQDVFAPAEQQETETAQRPQPAIPETEAAEQAMQMQQEFNTALTEGMTAPPETQTPLYEEDLKSVGKEYRLSDMLDDLEDAIAKLSTTAKGEEGMSEHLESVETWIESMRQKLEEKRRKRWEKSRKSQP